MKMTKKNVELKDKALDMKHQGNSTADQPDGFTGSFGEMSLKAKNLNGTQEVFGTGSKPSGFRGKSVPGEPSSNLDAASRGNNVGGGKM